MATFIPGGRQGMRNAMYGTMSQETVNFIQNNINSLTTRYGDSARQFQESLQQQFNAGALASIALARQNLEYAGTMFEDGIRTMRTVEDFRLATPMNQLYMRALPAINREIRSGRLSGWDNHDKYPNLTGERNPLFQSVMSGVVRYSDEEEIPTEQDFLRIYYTEEEERELELNEKLMIRQNWNRLYNLINQSGDEAMDPTSIEGSYL